MGPKRKRAPSAELQSETATPLSALFQPRFFDSAIWSRLIGFLALPDLHGLSAASRTTRAFVVHRQLLDKRRALKAGIRSADVRHQEFARLLRRLQRHRRDAAPLEDQSQMLSKVPDDGQEWLAPWHSVELWGSLAWTLADGQGPQIPGWQLGLPMDEWTPFDYRQTCPYAGVSVSADEHWLAILVHGMGNRVPSGQARLSVFRNGQRIHQFRLLLPEAVIGFINCMQLIWAWGQLYLLMANERRGALQTVFQIFSFSLESAPRRILDHRIPENEYWEILHSQDCFVCSLTDDQLQLRCLAWIGERRQFSPVLRTLALDRATEAVEMSTEPLSLDVELAGTVSDAHTNWALLGVGARFLAAIIRPKLQYYASASREYEYGKALPGQLVLLEKAAGGAWQQRYTFLLPGLLPPLLDCFELPGNNGMRPVLLRPQMLEEGLSVEDFVSGRPWLVLYSRGHPEDQLRFLAPSLA